MKKLLAAGVAALAGFAATGCYRAQEGSYHFGTPWGTDTIESRYERPVERVFFAAKDVLALDGTLKGENTIDHSLIASVDNRTVWVKVNEVQPGVSRVFVQARKSGGISDVRLASELDKQIALRLTAGR